MQIRTIEGAAKHYKELDKDTAVTAYAIRQAIISGALPSTKAGTKYLVSLENLESYFSGEMPKVQPIPHEHGRIYPIGERRA